jgi:AcrR family transcriptional regulator
VARAGLTPERVAVAGADLADEIGFEAVTISLLARRLAVKTPSLYSHVDGSEDLRVRIAAVALDDSARLMETAIAGRADGEALAAYADAWRFFAHEHPGRYAATRQRIPHAESEGALAAVAAGRRHAQVLRTVLASYRLDDPAQTHAIRLLGSLVHGYVSLELAGSFEHSEPSSGESWTYVVDVLDRLLRSDRNVAPFGSEVSSR